MAKKIKPTDQILLVQEPSVLNEKNNLKVVKGIDKNGNLETVDPQKAKPSDFLTIDKHADFLENFFKNFIAQAKNPKHTGFFIIAADMIDKVIHMKPEEFEQYRVKPEDFLNKKQESEQKKESTPEQKKDAQVPESKEAKPIDVNLIPNSEYEKYGITPESIAKELNAMSWGFKSPHLVDIAPKVGEEEFPLKARLSLSQQADGSYRIVAHPYQNKLDLEKPFVGVLLPEDVKKNLLETGHGGRAVELEPNGEKVPSLISIDPITNRIEAIPVANLKFERILGVELKPEQQNALKNGEKVLVENMTSKKYGKTFSDTVRYDAANAKLEFSMYATNRQQQGEGQGEKVLRKKEQGEQELKPRKVGEVWISPVQGGVKLSKEQYEKLGKGEAVKVEGMERKPKQGAQQAQATDSKGHKYNAWVWVDQKDGRIRHSSLHPDEIAQKQKQNVKPAAGYETQIAVNDKGKTNEATKQTKEPLKSGQVKPTEDQSKKTERKKPNKGLKV